MATIELAQGSYQGSTSNGVDSFLGVPYASPFKRFAAPEPPLKKTGIRDASKWGPICPQFPSRLQAVTGPLPPSAGPQDDVHCGVLSVFTPSKRSADSPLPVIVFAHGGAFVSGGSQIAWYDGGRLARDGDIVVVTINYRLGVFGFLPDRSQQIPPGTLDVIAAFEWVKANIAAFGGDPNNVTGFGQSAGAYHMQSLLFIRPHLLNRAILQSFPGGIGYTPDKGDLIRETVQSALDNSVTIYSAETEALLAAQGSTMRAFPGVLPAFVPSLSEELHRPSEGHKDVLIGWTKNDGACFAHIGGLDVATGGPRLTATIFKGPSLELAADLKARGHEVTAFELTWAPEGFELGATHCIDLPLIFGDQEAWKEAPMLGSEDWGEWEERGRKLRRAWGAFARDGTKPKSWDGVDVF